MSNAKTSHTRESEAKVKELRTSREKKRNERLMRHRCQETVTAPTCKGAQQLGRMCPLSPPRSTNDEMGGLIETVQYGRYESESSESLGEADLFPKGDTRTPLQRRPCKVWPSPKL
jgi:hypothetical protein